MPRRRFLLALVVALLCLDEAALWFSSRSASLFPSPIRGHDSLSIPPWGWYSSGKSLLLGRLAVLPAAQAATASRDPYRTLSVSRRATDKQIKAAYKKLVKKWHPDKNPGDPSAGDKFIQVKEAYDILSDPKRRREYDQHGTTDGSGGLSGGRGSQQWAGGGFRRRHDQQRYSYYTWSKAPDPHSVRLTSENWAGATAYDPVLNGVGDLSSARDSRSVSEPAVWLVFFYSDNCYRCKQAQPHWREAAARLRDSGVRTGTVHTDFEADLVRQLGVRRVPSFMALRTGPGFAKKKWLNGGRRRSDSTISPARLVRMATELLKDLATVVNLSADAKGHSVDSDDDDRDWGRRRGSAAPVDVPSGPLSSEALSFLRSSRSLKQRVAALLSGTFQPTYAKVVLLSTRSQPHVLFRYVAACLSELAFVVHIDTTHAGGSQAARLLGQEVEAAFRSGEPLLVVLREPGTPLQVIRDVPHTSEELLELLVPRVQPRLPRIDGRNFFEQCFIPFEEGRALSRDDYLLRSSKTRTCAIVIAPSRSRAWKVGLSLASPTSALDPLLRSGALALGWMSPSQQRSFLRTLPGRGSAGVVLIRGATSQVLSCPFPLRVPSDAKRVEQWIAERTQEPAWAPSSHTPSMGFPINPSASVMESLTEYMQAFSSLGFSLNGESVMNAIFMAFLVLVMFSNVFRFVG